MTERQPKFEIGQQFETRGKHPKVCTVTDILRTYNSAGEMVHFRYVAEHKFCGRTVVEHDVVEATIAMGIDRLVRSLIRASNEAQAAQ